jgi:hypothetical protein
MEATTTERGIPPYSADDPAHLKISLWESVSMSVAIVISHPT